MGCVYNQKKNNTCDDGAKIEMCKCNACDASAWKYPTCGTMKNAHEDYEAANRHKRLCHNVKLNPRLETNTIDGNAIDECNEENFVLKGEFEINNVERELNQMNFLSDLSLEKDKFKCFIKHLDKDMDRKYLVAAS